MDNIKKFNVCAAYILGKLYTEFPIRRMLDPGEMGKALNDVVPYDSDNRLGAADFCAYTLRWLVDTGYIIQEEGGTAASNRYVLAPKAFEALNSSLASLPGADGEATKTIGEQLSEIAKEEGKAAGTEAKREVISQMIGQIIGWAFRTASGV